MNQKPSLLIVDDEVDTCQNLFDIFTDMGHRVDIAFDGSAALEKVQISHYDIALLDLMMPGMDGIALSHEIHRLRPETVAILATAHPNHPRAEESRRLGVWQVIPKPVDLPRLFALVDEAVTLPTVLLVDDDADLCANLWDLLWQRGYRVDMAHDIRAAVKSLQDNQFNVVLVDMRLPDGEGTQIIQMLRQTNSSAGTILITGYAAELDASLDKWKEQGVDAICYKPFDVPGLLSTVQRLTRPKEH